MEMSTVDRLREVNRHFYEAHAEDFADARPRLPVGVRRVLARIPAGASVLDVGCGDGKVARALPHCRYLGLDQSAAMLRRAERFTADAVRRLTGAQPPSAPIWAPVFMQADVLDRGLRPSLPGQPFDWVLAFAVLHHIPGRKTRAAVVQALAMRLAPGGALALSTWQLARSERLLRRRVPWSRVGLAEADVEPGDYLISWERKGRHGVRYVHVLDRAETEALLAVAGLAVVEAFEADGISGNLADYVIGMAAEERNARWRAS